MVENEYSMSSSTEAIKISPENWRRLNAKKNPGDTFDDVVSRLLDEHGEALIEK